MLMAAVPWVRPVGDEAIRCEATVFVMDDRMGGWTNRCQLRKGHGGYHRHPLGACDPKAFMAWTGTHIDGPVCDPECRDPQSECSCTGPTSASEDKP